MVNLRGLPETPERNAVRSWTDAELECRARRLLATPRRGTSEEAFLEAIRAEMDERGRRRRLGTIDEEAGW